MNIFNEYFYLLVRLEERRFALILHYARKLAPKRVHLKDCLYSDLTIPAIRTRNDYTTLYSDPNGVILE